MFLRIYSSRQWQPLKLPGLVKVKKIATNHQEVLLVIVNDLHTEDIEPILFRIRFGLFMAAPWLLCSAEANQAGNYSAQNNFRSHSSQSQKHLMFMTTIHQEPLRAEDRKHGRNLAIILC